MSTCKAVDGAEIPILQTEDNPFGRTMEISHSDIAELLDPILQEVPWRERERQLHQSTLKPELKTLSRKYMGCGRQGESVKDAVFVETKRYLVSQGWHYYTDGSGVTFYQIKKEAP